MGSYGPDSPVAGERCRRALEVAFGSDEIQPFEVAAVTACLHLESLQRVGFGLDLKAAEDTASIHSDDVDSCQVVGQ